MPHSAYSRLLTPPKQSFFLFGARGTGKSTWVHHAFPAAEVVDLLDERTYEYLIQSPGNFAARIQHKKNSSDWVVVDEVQKLPRLLDEVHRLIELRAKKFVLLGSSARKLKRSGVNLLAGRALLRHMYPFMPSEIGSSFRLDQALELGTIPLIVSSEDPVESLRAYVSNYIKEEIQIEATVRHLPGFLRFLPIATLFHGQTLNTSSLSRDAGVARTTVEGFLSVLEDTLIAFRLEPYEAKLRVKERKHPKLYFIDPGIVRGIRRRFGPISLEEKGPLFEGLVATMLRAYNDYQSQSLFDAMYSWAPLQSLNTEVDFLLERDGQFVAIEAKSAVRFRAEDIQGLYAIEALKGLKRRIVVYCGNDEFVHDSIEVMPFERFDAALASSALWR